MSIHHVVIARDKKYALFEHTIGSGNPKEFNDGKFKNYIN